MSDHEMRLFDIYHLIVMLANFYNLNPSLYVELFLKINFKKKGF